MIGKNHGTGVGARWIAIALVLVAVLSASGFVRETLRSRQIDREIASLKAESERLKARNIELASRVQNLDSGEFLEREARLKLDLKKSGEEVVVVKSAAATTVSVTKDISLIKLTNPRKWFLYFTDRQAYDRYSEAT